MIIVLRVFFMFLLVLCVFEKKFHYFINNLKSFSFKFSLNGGGMREREGRREGGRDGHRKIKIKRERP